MMVSTPFSSHSYSKHTKHHLEKDLETVESHLSSFYIILTYRLKFLQHPRIHDLQRILINLCEHLSPTHKYLSQALIAGLPAKLNSAQLRRQAGGQCLGQIVSAINVHICPSCRCPRQIGGICSLQNSDFRDMFVQFIRFVKIYIFGVLFSYYRTPEKRTKWALG